MHKHIRALTLAAILLATFIGAIAQVRNRNAQSQRATLPRVVARVSLTGQTGSIDTTTLLTPPKDGLFRVSAYGVPTVLSTFGAIYFRLNWVDDAGQEQCPYYGGEGCFVFYPYGITYGADTFLVRAKAATPVTYSVFYDGSGAQYSLFITVEQLM